MLIDNISDLMVFTQAVKGGSLSAAARELGMSLAVASKRLRRLEDQLGVRLLNRSTRQLSLTDEGAAYYDYCVRILAELEEGEELVTRGSKEPKGNLKVTVPAAWPLACCAAGARFPGALSGRKAQPAPFRRAGGYHRAGL